MDTADANQFPRYAQLQALKPGRAHQAHKWTGEAVIGREGYTLK